MTREEEKNSLEYQTVKEAWKRYNTQSIDKDFDVISFEEGAEFGYNFAINKACEWLLEWETHQGEDIEVVKQFKQAMKGE